MNGNGYVFYQENRWLLLFLAKLPFPLVGFLAGGRLNEIVHQVTKCAQLRLSVIVKSISPIENEMKKRATEVTAMNYFPSLVRSRQRGMAHLWLTFYFFVLIYIFSGGGQRWRLRQYY